MRRREQSRILQQLIEAGGPLAEAISRVLRTPTEPLTPERLNEMKRRLLEWDVAVLAIDKELLE